MTREEAKELLPIIQAYAEGKTIQMKTFDNDNWCDTTGLPLNFDCEPRKYRIKPDEIWRPYKDYYEMIEDFKKRFNAIVPSYIMPSIWVKHNSDISIITRFDKSRPEGIYINNTYRNFDDLFECYTYLDDSPCGVKE